MIFIRQTSIAFLLGGLFYLFFNKKKNYKKILIFLISFLILFKLNSLVGDSISPDIFNLNYAFGILFFDFSNLNQLIRFLGLPLVSFFPLILLFFLSMKFKNTANFKIYLTCLLILILMIGQPIMGGPDYTQRNVVRIATLSYIIATYFLIYTFDHNKLFKNNLLFFSFIIGLFFWSLHPLYSKFNFFSFLRF